MRSIDVAMDVDAPAAAAWAALSRYEHWPAWGPSVRAVDPAAGDVRPGASGRVQTAVGPWVPFEVLEVDPGRRWTWRVAGVPATGHRVEATSADRCRVAFEVPLWAAGYAVVCRLAIPRIEVVARRLA